MPGRLHRFLENHQDTLWLAVAARNAGQTSSKLAGLEDELGEDSMICLDFNLACAFRLEIYEKETRRDLAQLIALEIQKAEIFRATGMTQDGANSSTMQEIPEDDYM